MRQRAFIAPSDGTAALFARPEQMSAVTVRRDGMKEDKEAELLIELVNKVGQCISGGWSSLPTQVLESQL